MIKVSDYIVNFLVEKGIKDVFFIDGSACASLIVAVAKNKNLQYYCNHHEQAGAFAVDGYYKASGKVSVMIATSGPAGQNLINGIAASYYDSIPAIYITGNINSKFMKPNNDIRQHGFQENDIVSMVKNVTKRVILLKNPIDIKYELELAYHEATTGRPGPVLLDIPMNIQQSVIDENEMFCSKFRQAELSISHLLLDIDNCIRMLRKAKRPVILIGGGVRLSKADKEVKQLIEELKIPVYVTWNMIDFCPNDYPYYGGRVGTFGGDGRNFGIQNCDLLLSIGSRISGRITGGMIDTFARGAKKIIVDIDPAELNYQQIRGDLNIICDAKLFVSQLFNIFSNSNIRIDYSQWLAKTIEWKHKYPVVKKEYWDQKDSVNPYVFVKVLSSEMKEGDVLVHEAGGNCVVTSQAFEAKDGQRVFSNNGNSSLGYALPAAIGACIATKKQVICIVGDGGFQFNIQELQTAKHYMLPVKVFIFNNEAYGITKAYRDTNFQSEYAGVDAEHGQSNPDFIKVVEAYGIKTVKIDNHSEMLDGIREVLSYPGPVVCDINMKGFYDYQPKLGWRNPIEDQYPFLPREEFRQNMIIDPIEGWENPQYP